MSGSDIANVDYSLSGYDGLCLLLYHVTGSAGLTGIEQCQAMKSGARGKLGGAIYFADTEAVAQHKALSKGITLVALVEVGRIMVLSNAYSNVTKEKLEKVGCSCIKSIYPNGAEYIIYDPTLVKVVWVTSGSPTGPRVVFPASDPRPLCKYNGECMQRDPHHFSKYKHSVPPKFPMRIPTPEQREPCKYGAGCMRKNPEHFKKYSHPPSVLVPQVPARPAVYSGLPMCEYGFSCRRTNPEHFKQCSHPPGFRPICRYYKEGCRNKSPDHLQKYRHE